MAKRNLLHLMYRHFVGDTKGWIEVEKNELTRLGILSSISTSSYIKGNYIYLDEDLDSSLFLCSLGYDPEFTKVAINDTYFDNYEQFKESLQ